MAWRICCRSVRTIHLNSHIPCISNSLIDFRSRLTTLLSFPRFRDFGSATALSILDAVNSWEGLSDVETSKSRGKPRFMINLKLALIVLQRLATGT